MANDCEFTITVLSSLIIPIRDWVFDFGYGDSLRAQIFHHNVLRT